MNKNQRGLTDKTIQVTINTIKIYWPQYAITTSDIRNPTKEFVLKFFAECINDMDNKCVFVMKQDVLPQPVGFPPEDIMYWKLSKIPSLANEGFKLADLYIFEPKRLNKLMFMTIHFLLFSESLINNMARVTNSVFEAQQKIQQDKEDLENAKQQKMEKQILLTSAKEHNKQLTKLATSLAPQYEETVVQMDQCQQKCNVSKLQVAQLKINLEVIQEEIETLKKTEAQLQSKIVPEKEYMKLQIKLDSLINDAQNLEEVDDNNGLLQQKQKIEHLQMCIQELNSLHLPNELLKLADLRVQLKNQQQSINYNSVAQERTHQELSLLNKQLEAELTASNAQNRSLKADLQKTTDEALLQEIKAKAKHKALLMKQQQQIEQLERIIADDESECQILQNDFDKKFQEITRTLEAILETYVSFTKFCINNK